MTHCPVRNLLRGTRFRHTGAFSFPSARCVTSPPSCARIPIGMWESCFPHRVVEITREIKLSVCSLAVTMSPRVGMRLPLVDSWGRGEADASLRACRIPIFIEEGGVQYGCDEKVGVKRLLVCRSVVAVYGDVGVRRHAQRARAHVSVLKPDRKDAGSGNADCSRRVRDC